jgi:cellulose synthase/poly-beta-1,6-N-acetylglucosamine synthase-like glycosyltransferase
MPILDGIDLVRAVRGDARDDLAAATDLYQDALSHQVDPLHYLITRHGYAETAVVARAAAWAGLDWTDRLPPGIGPTEAPPVDRLARMRSVSLAGPDGPILFVTARTHEVVRLREVVRRDPALARRYVLVGPSVMRRHAMRIGTTALLDAARHRLARAWPNATAHLDVTLPIRLAFVLAVALAVGLAGLSPLVGAAPVIVLTFGIVIAPALMRLAAMKAIDRWHPPRERRPSDSLLPVYSIVLPMRDEAGMVPQLIASLKRLDYPPDKLEFVFVVEGDCPATLAAVRRQMDDPRIVLVPVPPAAPRTKPKAMNFVLPLLAGECVVVYDAEDRPDPDQLWRAAARFRADPALVCLQAELVLDNRRRWPLTTIFAGEYAGLFGVFLPALARWRVPLPLGGTSNHFRLDRLRAIGGWDSFNVTEDADLGMRMARRGWRVGTLASLTYEEAPDTISAWLRQRTRWIKGWMQTLIVHNRHPRLLLADLGWRGFAFFQIIVLGMILAPLLHVSFALSLALSLIGAVPWVVPQHHWLAIVYFAVLVLGLFAAWGIQVVGLLRQERKALVPTQILLPLYWLLLAIATVRALRELLVNPFYWAKTTHHPVGEPPPDPTLRRFFSVGRDTRRGP